MAKRIKTQQSFISKYESNDRKIDVMEFIKIANALGVRPIDVLRKIVSELELKNKK